MTSTAFAADDTVKQQITLWQRELGAVRRLAPKTLEAYDRDLAQFVAFLSGHVGGAVTLGTLRELRGTDIRAFMASRRADSLTSRSLAARTSKRSSEGIEMAPTSPRKLRGSAGPRATARNGEPGSGSPPAARASQPSGVDFTPGVPDSM